MSTTVSPRTFFESVSEGDLIAVGNPRGHGGRKAMVLEKWKNSRVRVYDYGAGKTIDFDENGSEVGGCLGMLGPWVEPLRATLWVNVYRSFDGKTASLGTAHGNLGAATNEPKTEGRKPIARVRIDIEEGKFDE